MFNLFEHRRDASKKEIFPTDGIYIVREQGVYSFTYTSSLIISNIVFVEDEAVDSRFILEYNSNKIVVSEFDYFNDYFGFANVIVNGESFTFNILGEKFELKEIEEIILYLFDRNHEIITKFISKSSLHASNKDDGKEYIKTSKYIHFATVYIEEFENLYSSFYNISHKNVKREVVIDDYEKQMIDSSSIEWIFQNLDTIQFDFSYKNQSNSLNVGTNYGSIEKIAANRSVNSYSVYENQIILGGFRQLKMTLLDLRNTLKNAVSNEKVKYVNKSQYADFRDLKIIPFLKMAQVLDDVLKRLTKVNLAYQRLFKNIVPIISRPKLTSVFSNSRHYRRAFESITNLFKKEFSLTSEIQLLNIKKLSTLYEYYNLFRILDYFSTHTFIKNKYLVNDEGIISKVDFIIPNSNELITIYYQGVINNISKETGLITIGNSKLAGTFCKPDFIIKVASKKEDRFLILDAKYSKMSTIEYAHLPSCVFKYLIDVGVVNNKYQKPDALVILHPDSSRKAISQIYNKSYFPQIETVVSKPGFEDNLNDFLDMFLQFKKPGMQIDLNFKNA